jgi:hypothetical protein
MLTLACVGAQDDKAVFKLYPLESEGTSQEDARLLETLIQSYFSDKKDVTILLSGIDDTEMGSALALAPNYFVKSSLQPDENGYIFEIIIDDAFSRELSRQTAKYKSAKDIALNMHNIVNAVLEWRSDVEYPSLTPDTDSINDENILGLWSGDIGIKFVRILPNGKAFAFFTSGVNMMLSYEIESNTLIIRQVSKNNENFYFPQPISAAKVLVNEAEPMRWEFMLYENESLLKGTRVETIVEFEDYEKIVIRHNSIQESEWSRLSR